MASMSILNLSNEILWNIFGYFCLHCQHEYNQSWDDRPFRSQDSSRGKQQPDAKSWYSIDRHALFSLSLTSKRFCDLAQPILYHEFVLGYGDSWLSESYTWEGRLVSFIRTLSRRSDLAHRVKVMYIHTSLFGRNTDESRTANRLVILEAAHALGIDLPEAWRQRMSRVTDAESCDWPEVYQVFLGCYLDDKCELTERQRRHLHRAMTDGSFPGRRWMNAELVAILIAQTPHLEYLSLQGDNRWPSCGLAKSSLSALGVSNLPLKTLDLGIGGYPIIELAPGLETLNLHQYTLHFGHSIPNMPSLRTLRVTDSLMLAVTLRKLLDACTGGLVAFEYEAAKDETQGLRGGHFQASDAIEYLDKHKSTLQVLHLDLSKRDVQMRKIPPDSSLKEFSALKHVFINSMPLFGFIQKREQNVDSRVLIRLLPPSIASLTIEKNHYRNFVKEALFDLADWKIQNPGEFPNLTWVACRPKSKSSTLASLFQAVGVNFNAQVRSLSNIKPYLNGPNASSILVFPNWDSDDDL
ncbi:hypothetical protein MRS44_011806 [Fusarium solani]|uniref:Uncharacterized protein n=1 Tax=Fusarium solani TaxID=169388 RepID=A0A9P9KSW5_FUSSL|nr:uncharacterized protein B0J15DRAFT_486241 [Fusarium solani]KAH7267904.1 hypothetical protein B0J15DRAFT_486241 [Fusarium solani]KAJ3460939.1 hypothetical protein MRS44_011806 [Fusarium solani]